MKEETTTITHETVKELYDYLSSMQPEEILSFSDIINCEYDKLSTYNRLKVDLLVARGYYYESAVWHLKSYKLSIRDKIKCRIKAI